jgi:hypothetical protein
VLQMSCLDMVYHSEFYLLGDVCVTTMIVVGTNVITHNIEMG